MRIPNYLTPVVIIGIASGMASGQAPADENLALGKAAIAAYSAHMRSFEFYSCRYTSTQAQSPSVEDALQGKWINVQSYDSRLLVDGDKELCEGLAALPDIKKLLEKQSPGKNQPAGKNPTPGKKEAPKRKVAVAVFGNSDRYLGDGQREMNYSQVMQTVNLFSAEKRVHGVDGSPLGLQGGQDHRNSDLDMLLKSPDVFEFSVDGWREIDGRPTVVLRFRHKQDKWMERVYWLDTTRGHLPIRITSLWHGKPKIQFFVTHVRECGNQRWFPERSISVTTPDVGNLYSVFEMKVAELDTKKRPDRKEFAVTIPAGTSVHEFETPWSFFKFKQDERVGVEDLPKLFEMVRNVPKKPLTDTALPPSNQYVWVRWTAGAAGAVMVVGGLGFLVKRRRGVQ